MRGDGGLVWPPLLSPYGSTQRSLPEIFLGKGVLKIWSKFTGEHPCGSVISIFAALLNLHFGMGVFQ